MLLNSAIGRTHAVPSNRHLPNKIKQPFMKTIRKISTHPATLGFICLTVMLFSCTGEVNQSKELSGRDIFRSVYFIDGPAIDLMEPLIGLQLKDLVDEEHLQAVRSKIDSFLDQMQLDQPQIFSDFKKDMTSGDHIVIGQSLNRYAEVMRANVDKLLTDDPWLQVTAHDKTDGLAKLIQSHFPEISNPTSTENVKSVLKSEEFQTKIQSYFDVLASKSNLKTGNGQERVCSIIVGAAVLVVAALAIVVIYVVWILAAVHSYTATAHAWYSLPAAQSVMMQDQLVNYIASNPILK
jgi:SdpC family antimicrobial peptide